VSVAFRSAPQRLAGHGRAARTAAAVDA